MSSADLSRVRGEVGRASLRGRVRAPPHAVPVDRPPHPTLSPQRGRGEEADVTVRATANGLAFRISQFSDRRFKYLVIAPAILILLLIGLFPLIYTLVVSVQTSL